MPNALTSARRIRSLTRSIMLAAALAVWAVAAGPTVASPGSTITGGGSASDMTRFALGITNGTGPFECVMPAMMTVEATATGVDTISASSATFHGTAQVTLAAGTPFGPPGPMPGPVPFSATVAAGGPGVGSVDLEIMGMSFAGTVVHGQISIAP